MLWLVSGLQKSTFLRSVAAIAGGTAVAQALGVLFSPLLTRLYSPEAMGLLGLFVSFMGVVSVLATLRYEIAIVAVASEEDAVALTRSSITLGLVTALLGAFVLELLRKGNFLGYGSLPAWAPILVFPALLGSSWGVVLRYYSVRRARFGLVGKFLVYQGVTRIVSQLILSPLETVGLFAGEVLGRFMGLAAIWRVLPKKPGAWFSPTVLIKYKVYPLVQLPSGFFDTLALMAPVPIFAALYGPGIGGSLVLAQRVIGLPLNLIGAAVADVFYSRASEIARTTPHSLRFFLLATVTRLSLISLPLGIGLWFFAPKIVPWVFGREWEAAGEMIAALAPWFSAMLAVSPVTRVVFLSRYGWIKLTYDVLSVAVVSSPLYLDISDPRIAINLLSWLKTTQLGLYLLLLLLLVQPARLMSSAGGENE